MLEVKPDLYTWLITPNICGKYLFHDVYYASRGVFRYAKDNHIADIAVIVFFDN